MKRTGSVYISDDALTSEEIVTEGSSEEVDIVVSEEVQEKSWSKEQFEETIDVYEESEHVARYSHDDEKSSEPDLGYQTTQAVEVEEKTEENLIKIEKNHREEKNNEKRVKVEKKDNPSKHGELFIEIKKQKRKKKKKKAGGLHFKKVNLGNIKIKKSKAQKDVSRSDNNDYTTDKGTYYSQDTDLEQDKSSSNNSDDNNNVEESDYAKTNAVEEQKGKDLGADIIVLIIIGLIAGVAGFSYIFTQLGLLNR